MDLVQDVEQVREGDTDGFNELVLPSEYKDIIRALIKMHARTPGATFDERRHDNAPTRETDIVKGKGKGLVILLHGAPGVGKTSTAECVAANTDRPLFPITCGDIGGNSIKEVERNLEGYFDLARKWGCVLLLDEADVFLSERIRGDIKQNSLVSGTEDIHSGNRDHHLSLIVFLRALEYYSGVLILTTNRVGDFDEAITSRIHCSLYYPPLDKENTMKIWKMNLSRLDHRKNQKPSNLSLDFDRKEILGFAKEHYKAGHRWNGRQIKNSFQTAIALAEWDNLKFKAGSTDTSRPLLEKRHFEKVAKASAHFDLYLTTVRTSDEQRVKTKEIRRDDVRHVFSDIATVDPPAMKIKAPGMTKSPAYHSTLTYSAAANSGQEETDTSSGTEEETDEDIKELKLLRQEGFHRIEREDKRQLQL